MSTVNNTLEKRDYLLHNGKKTPLFAESHAGVIIHFDWDFIMAVCTSRNKRIS